MAKWRGLGTIAALLVAWWLAGCVHPGGALTVSGTATYRERIALPPDAVFEAFLEEVPRADAPAVVVSSVRVPSPKVPIAFTIAYDPSRIDNRQRHVVRGRITLNGQLMFTSDTAHPVLGPNGVRTVDMLLRRVAGSAVAGEARRMVGLYRYMADAASFIDCVSGDQFPVAPEGDGPALQAAYVAARVVPGEPQLASVEARIVMRAPEPGGAPRPALQVERVIGLSAQSSCATPPAGHATLENTYWKLASLRGQPVAPPAERQREAHLILQPAQRRVVGSGGCNRLSGAYTLDGERLTFSRAIGTMMACRDGMDQERALLDTLTQVARWRIDGQRLALLDERGATLLLFDAVYLR
ncbi:MAG TPA: META domain-containing protein [Burkholderiaceae bacterium]|nr:META domain-containing protein [Burkholderiaceae bacterium]